MIKKHFDLSDYELLTKTAAAAKTEKEAMMTLLEYLCEVDERKVYATKSYSSLFEYLMKELLFSEAQASERVNAVRLMRSMPEVKDHLETGKLNLSTAAKIQRFVQAENKLATPLNPNKKTELVQECLGQSKRQVEKILFAHASEPNQIAMKERITVVSEDKIELKITLTAQVEEKLKRAKQLVRTETMAALLEKALDALIDLQEKKLGKSTSAEIKPNYSTLPAKLDASTRSRYIPKAFKKVIYQRSGGQCEYSEPKTKKRCESRAHLEIDHVVPMARNGKTELNNLRHLCHSHNARAAMDWFS